MKLLFILLSLFSALALAASERQLSALRRQRRVSPVGGACSKDRHCSPNSYCNGGRCARRRSCDEDADCYNPGNMGGRGNWVCRPRGRYVKKNNRAPAGRCARRRKRCRRRCDVSPCSASACDRAVRCVDDRCGGCRAIFFDAAGNHVCKKKSTVAVKSKKKKKTVAVKPVVVKPVPQPGCRSSDECGSGEYCASSDGRCREIGTCGDSSPQDCSDPNNAFSERSLCGAEPTCGDEDNRCRIECPCSTSSDCVEGAYCSIASGKCIEDGTCVDDVDCLDPDNAAVNGGGGCFGLLSCNQEGRCEERCFDDDCRSSTSTSTAAVVPCRPCDSNMRKDKCEGSVTCRENFCGGCNYLFFDTSGEKMCEGT